MSWSASIAKGPIAGFEDRARQNFTAQTPEAQEQFDAALKAVAALIPTVQPDPNGLIVGSVSGHANTGHKKTPGWSNDYVSVSVNQADSE